MHFIISLTTLPNRKRSINRVLHALCNQNYDQYEVHLNVPSSTKHDGTFDRTFSFLKSDRLKVFYVDDVGAITKLYHTLRRTEDGEQRIITVDDDFIYAPNMLEVYADLLQHDFHDDTIGFAGIWPVGAQSDGSLTFVGCVQPGQPQRVGLLEGYKSVCYKRRFFDDEFFHEWYQLHHEDDLTLSSWLGYKNVKKYCVPFAQETEFRNRTMSFPLSAVVTTPLSGVYHYRKTAGDTSVSYAACFSSELGEYLRR